MTRFDEADTLRVIADHFFPEGSEPDPTCAVAERWAFVLRRVADKLARASSSAGAAGNREVGEARAEYVATWPYAGPDAERSAVENDLNRTPLRVPPSGEDG